MTVGPSGDGGFTMGQSNVGLWPSNGGTEYAGVNVGAFELDAYEVTVARFRAFFDDGMHTPDAGTLLG